MLAADAPRYAEHPTLAPVGVVGVVNARERHVRLALLLKAVAQVMQRSLREQIQDRPVIGSWTALLDYLQAAMQHETAEHFRLLFLDRKNILIRDEVQSRGTVDHTPLYPREVVKRALELGASALIMVHNHPSGDPTPSQADIDMTRQVTGRAGAGQHHGPRPHHRRQEPPHQLQDAEADLSLGARRASLSAKRGHAHRHPSPACRSRRCCPTCAAPWPPGLPPCWRRRRAPARPRWCRSISWPSPGSPAGAS